MAQSRRSSTSSDGAISMASQAEELTSQVITSEMPDDPGNWAISQTAFQTQMPFFLPAQHDTLPVKGGNQHGSGDHDASTETTFDQAALLRMLGPRPDRAVNKQFQSPPQITPRNAPIETTNDSISIDNQTCPGVPLEAASSPPITQLPLQTTGLSARKSTTPTSISPLKPVRAGTMAQTDRVPETALSQMSLLPSDMQHRFQRWRNDAMADRYLPRHFTRIPKPQAALLDTADSYWPPLAGRDCRPGTVPLDLLNDLTSKADQLAIAQHKGPLEQQSRTDDSSTKVSNLDSVVANRDQIFSSNSSVSWSQSPEPISPAPVRRKGQLPPDSPVGQSKIGEAAVQLSSPVEVHIEVDDTRDAAMEDMYVESEHESEGEGENRGSAPISSVLNANSRTFQAAISATLPTSSAGKAEMLVSVLGNNPHHDGTSHLSNTADVVSTAQRAGVRSNERMQVTRGSCLGKGVASESLLGIKNLSPRESIESGHDRIACAYEDIRLQPNRSRKDTKTIFTQSSQDPPIVGTQNESHTALSKRRASGAGSQMSSKRPRLVSKGRQTGSIDPDFAAVIQANRERRSAEMSRFAKEQAVPQQQHSGSAGSPIRDAKSKISDALTDSDVSRAQFGSELYQGQSSPITIPSDIPNPASDLPQLTRTATRSSISKPNNRDLFQLFSNTYADYGGNYNDFENGYGSLKRARQNECALHPSLFDDFVFKHWSQFGPYLTRVAKSSEDPLTYARYYDEYVDVSTHNRGVLTKYSLDGIASKLVMFKQKSSEHGATRSDATDSGGTGSVGVHSSASNKVAGPPGEKTDSSREQLRDTTSDQSKTAERPTESIIVNMELSQPSSVESWVAQVRQGSPELGTPGVDRSQEPKKKRRSLPWKPSPTSQSDLRQATKLQASTSEKTPALRKMKSAKSSSPFVPMNKQLAISKHSESKWWKHDNTPLKQFAAQFQQLQSVKLEQTELLPTQAVNIATWR